MRHLLFSESGIYSKEKFRKGYKKPSRTKEGKILRNFPVDKRRRSTRLSTGQIFTQETTEREIKQELESGYGESEYKDKMDKKELERQRLEAEYEAYKKRY